MLIKCFLNISSAEQKERLIARLDDPTKHWKYNPGDVDERAKWPAYLEAYRAVLERCNTERAPWYVIPPIASGIEMGRGATARRAPASPRPAVASCRFSMSRERVAAMMARVVALITKGLR